MISGQRYELSSSRASGMIGFRENGACREEIVLYGRAIAPCFEEQELGTLAGEVCRKLGIAQATLFQWGSRFAGLGPSDLRRLSQLEEAKTRLMELVAGLSLDTIMLRDVMR